MGILRFAGNLLTGGAIDRGDAKKTMESAKYYLECSVEEMMVAFSDLKKASSDYTEFQQSVYTYQLTKLREDLSFFIPISKKKLNNFQAPKNELYLFLKDKSENIETSKHDFSTSSMVIQNIMGMVPGLNFLGFAVAKDEFKKAIVDASKINKVAEEVRLKASQMKIAQKIIKLSFETTKKLSDDLMELIPDVQRIKKQFFKKRFIYVIFYVFIIRRKRQALLEDNEKIIITNATNLAVTISNIFDKIVILHEKQIKPTEEEGIFIEAEAKKIGIKLWK